MLMISLQNGQSVLAKITTRADAIASATIAAAAAAGGAAAAALAAGDGRAKPSALLGHVGCWLIRAQRQPDEEQARRGNSTPRSHEYTTACLAAVAAPPSAAAAFISCNCSSRACRAGGWLQLHDGPRHYASQLPPIITILTCSRWKGLRYHVLWLLGGPNR
eukprot:COSAG06_NODE_16694_length_986_cov_1.598647_1_plen_161_part_10